MSLTALAGTINDASFCLCPASVVDALGWKIEKNARNSITIPPSRARQKKNSCSDCMKFFPALPYSLLIFSTGMPVELPVGSILSNQLHVNLANQATRLHFDGHVLVGLFQLLVPLLEGGVAFDALLQLRFHLPRPLDLLPEIRAFSCTAVDQTERQTRDSFRLWGSGFTTKGILKGHSSRVF